MITAFFGKRVLSGPLETAVRVPLEWMQQQRGRYFAWLCVTNAGADRVNKAVLMLLGISARELEGGILGDAKVFRSYKICLHNYRV